MVIVRVANHGPEFKYNNQLPRFSYLANNRGIIAIGSTAREAVVAARKSTRGRLLKWDAIARRERTTRAGTR